LKEGNNMGWIKDGKKEKETKEVEDLQKPVEPDVEYNLTQKLIVRSMEFQNVIMKDIKKLNDTADTIKHRAGWIVLFLVLIFILGSLILFFVEQIASKGW
jgi:flagellar biosynthesis/type III secretory pathway M-ring protein FliF/YscJ